MGDRYDRMSCSNGKMLLPNDSEVDTIDKYCGGVKTINDPESKLHYGKYFSVSDIDEDVDTGSPKYWLFLHDGHDLHIRGNVKSDSNGIVEFFEDPTITDNGSSITAYNNNRTNDELSDVVFYQDPTISDDGTRLIVHMMGNRKRVGGSDNIFSNWILNTKETDYILKFTPDSNSTRAVVNIAYHFYNDIG